MSTTDRNRDVAPASTLSLAQDAYAVHKVIRGQPGIPSKRAIAEATGLSESRVARVVKPTTDTGHAPVAYGEVDGRRGWYAMNNKRHLRVIDQADAHDAAIEAGLRRSRERDARYRARPADEDETS